MAGLAGGAILVGGMLNSGCLEKKAVAEQIRGARVQVIEQVADRIGFDYNQDERTKRADIYFCNAWKDHNLNGRVDYGELEGIKNNFTRNETLMVIAPVKGYKGESIKSILIKKGGIEPIHEKRERIHTDYRVFSVIYDTNWIKKQAGIGDYRVGMYSNNKLINVAAFRIN